MYYIAFLFGLVVFSQVGNIARFAECSTFAICFWRLIFASLMVTPLLLHNNRWRQIAQLSLSDWARVALAGASLFLVFTLFVVGIQSTTVANTTILFSLHPLFTAIGAALFLKEKFSKRLALGLLFGFTGVATLFADSLHLMHGQVFGDFAALASALFFSCYFLIGKVVRQKMSNSSFAFLVYMIAALCSAAVMVTRSVPFSGYSDQSWLAFLALAAGPTLLGHAVFTWCLKHLNINMMSCSTLIHAPLAALGAYLAFGEQLSTYAVVSILLTGAAIVMIATHANIGVSTRSEGAEPYNDAIGDAA